MFVDILPPRGLEVLDLLSATLPMEKKYLGVDYSEYHLIRSLA